MKQSARVAGLAVLASFGMLDPSGVVSNQAVAQMDWLTPHLESQRHHNIQRHQQRLQRQETAAQVNDHLGVPGPIQFDGKSYKLVWSSRPGPGYVKQEYLPSGQNIGSHTQMLIIERVIGDLTVMGTVRAQVDMLKKRKATDPLVNMNVIENANSGEALLDFIVSSKDPKGEYIVEWNAYRYAPLKSASDKSGVLLFAISRRAYGNENAKTFMGQLKNVRTAQITALTKAAMPNVGP